VSEEAKALNEKERSVGILQNNGPGAGGFCEARRLHTTESGDSPEASRKVSIKMNIRTISKIGGIMAGVLVCWAGQAQALTVDIFTADSVFTGLTRTFESEGRIGNRQTNGTFEADIGPSTASPAQTAQRVMTSGQAFDFSLTYNPTTSLASFYVQDAVPATLQYTVLPPLDGFATDALFLRVRAVDTANDTVLLSNLVLDGVSISNLSAGLNTGNGDLGIFRLMGSELLDGFTLTGQATMTWGTGGGLPQNSQLAFQIKGVDLTPVPLPAGAWLFGSGVVALAGLARRNSLIHI
jgi:hypothetical protein